ncbi:uncharacterized protein TRAVEDRAFT_123382 [Trametes versicolor FP-101664 SS1]|uniref:uncharacterized protein n=1 Tax=Trametes versicolor (strain FP-101664) TaxID=717944 RepID=UPI00046233B6|nr:uncharacterized protein TRAVEDRAFT_123382 [Trametes versicolor FP-101664 SS1]EIW58325.1 hypothetical protein TRAVEDRAFT_123382 [Trametes versicolor FP-101664 SS1]
MLGVACASFATENGERRTWQEKLWTILCSESTYLVWKLRCERVIKNEGIQFTAQEVKQRWYATINRRLTLDRNVAKVSKVKRKEKIRKVQNTWCSVLADVNMLPVNWVVNSEVLVGIR